MLEPDPTATAAPKDDLKRQARADRILDAAADLILRWGYDKTTVDDIAKKAGVAKGTLYLHWKTREALFGALILRESLRMMADYRAGLAADPAGGTLRGIYKHAALALIRRPLLKSVLLGDQAVLGRLAGVQQDPRGYNDKVAGFRVYLDFLRARGLIRADLSFEAQVYTVTAIFLGFFHTAPLMPPELHLADEIQAELIGETIHRTLESGRVVTDGELRAVMDEFLAYLDRITAHTAELYRQTLISPVRA